MTVRTVAAQSPFALSQADRARLGERVQGAIERARRSGQPTLAALTVAVDPDLDPSAIAIRSQRPDDRFFCIEQPDRDGFALAGLGTAGAVEAHGADRFAQVARRTRLLAREALAGGDAADPDAPPASGPVWVGGFAFAADGGGSREWSSLAPAQLVLPEVSLARKGGQARLTVAAVADGDESREALIGRIVRRLGNLTAGELPLLDPDPVERPRVDAPAPPAHYEAAVERGVELIAGGELEKIVLARQVRVHAPATIDPGPVFDALRGAFPACYCYCVGTPELAFVGASPELLVRREGARAQTVALAGTTRRSADPSVDALLGEQLLQSPKNREEQAIVARRIEQTLKPVSLWVAAGDEPGLVKVQNVQHLATPIRAQLAEPLSAVELAGLLHPTPAVGGEPRERAVELIPALEGLDRGWYAGPIGWTDLAEDGEFCVALRCALLRGDVAHLYAGDGIVRDSVPAEELAETEVKLAALLPLLT